MSADSDATTSASTVGGNAISKEEQILLDSVSNHEHASMMFTKNGPPSTERVFDTPLSSKPNFFEKRASKYGGVSAAQTEQYEKDLQHEAIWNCGRSEMGDALPEPGERTHQGMMFSKDTKEMPERGTTKLRVVDPYEDEGIWAIVDEGANSNTHSDAWRKNAEKKWERLGFQCYLRNATITTFSGVGSKASSGKYQLPCGLRLEESYMILPGGLSSHEMPNSNHPLLLSQSFQAKLGFQKDVRDGTITMKEYDGQSLEVVRQIRTGLFMVRIDHLDRSMFEGAEDASLVKCLIPQPSLVTPGSGIA